MTRYYKTNDDGEIIFDLPTLEDAILHGCENNTFEGELISGWDGGLYLREDDVPEKPTDISWGEVKLMRDQILQSTQFRIAEDEPDRDLWLAYRAAVRAVMDQTDPLNITWPVPPA